MAGREVWKTDRLDFFQDVRASDSASEVLIGQEQLPEHFHATLRLGRLHRQSQVYGLEGLGVRVAKDAR